MNHLVYAMLDPRTGYVRYVGKSSYKRLSQRKRFHMNDTSGTHKSCWIQQLRSLGLSPEFVVLEEYATHVDALDGERSWISLLKSWELPLTNATEGGEGSSGHSKSVDTKEKIRLALQGRTRPDEVKRQIALSRLGKPHSAETRAKLSAAKLGKKLSTETRQKLSEAAYRRYSK